MVSQTASIFESLGHLIDDTSLSYVSVLFLYFKCVTQCISFLSIDMKKCVKSRDLTLTYFKKR
jgi:hypothetical protein